MTMKIFEPLSEIDPIFKELLTNAISYEIAFKNNGKGLPPFNYQIVLDKKDFEMYVKKIKLRGTSWYAAMNFPEERIPIRNTKMELKHCFHTYHKILKKSIGVTISGIEMTKKTKAV